MVSKAKVPLILISLTIFLLSGLAPTSAEGPKLKYCANPKSLEIKSIDAILDCNQGEIYLGAGALTPSKKSISKLNSKLLNRFTIAKAQAKKEGVYIYIASGYRSIARQAFLFERAKKRHGSYEEAIKWVSPPDLSMHPKGLAIDVNYPNDPKGAAWLESNGSRFGLCRVFENEWWHFEAPIPPGGTCPNLLENASIRN